VIGYDTRFDLKLPDRTGADAVASFFRGNLQPEWLLVEELDGPVLNFRMGQALASINLESWHEHLRPGSREPGGAWRRPPRARSRRGPHYPTFGASQRAAALRPS
jgi:hypothetical protein